MIATDAATHTVRDHRWELAGLGVAPFKYLGMYENRFDMGGGRSKPGGTCNYCGQGILYCFKVESSDGKRFVVGCDCIAHCHDPAERIVQQAKRALRDFKRVKAGEGKAAKRKAAAEARAAQWAAEREANIASLAADPLYQRLKAHPSREFLVKMRESMERFGALTEGQEAAAVVMLDRIEAEPARKAASRHLGAVGARVAISATVEMSKCIYQGVDRYDPSRYLNKLRTDEGAAVVWFGNYGLKTGAKIAGTATVKALDEYQGEKQTTIRNPRWKDAA